MDDSLRDQAITELLATTLDELDTAVIVAREGCAVVAMNAAARSLTSIGGGISVRDGVLQLRLHSEQMELRSAIGRAMSSAPVVTDACIAASRPGGGRPLVLRVRTLSVRGGAAAAVFVVDPERRLGDSACHLRIVYGLTRSELRVVRELMQGSEPCRIAESLFLSTYTVRTHLRNIFAKTGARNQADLIRLVATVPTFLRDAANGGEARESSESWRVSTRARRSA